MGGGGVCDQCGGLGGRGLEINKIKSTNPKTCLGFIIIYFRVGFLILLFTYRLICTF